MIALLLLSLAAAPLAPQDQAVFDAFQRLDYRGALKALESANPHYQDDRGRGWLFVLVDKLVVQESAYKALIARGEDVNQQDKDGETPLLANLTRGDRSIPVEVPAITSVLLRLGANPNLRSQNESPIERILHRQSNKTLALFLREGKPDLNAPNPRGQTVAQVFVMTGCGNNDDAERVDLLVGAGVDFNKKGMYGKSARELAEKNHCKALVPRMVAPRKG